MSLVPLRQEPPPSGGPAVSQGSQHLQGLPPTLCLDTTVPRTPPGASRAPEGGAAPKACPEPQLLCTPPMNASVWGSGDRAAHLPASCPGLRVCLPTSDRGELGLRTSNGAGGQECEPQNHLLSRPFLGAETAANNIASKHLLCPIGYCRMECGPDTPAGLGQGLCPPCPLWLACSTPSLNAEFSVCSQRRGCCGGRAGVYFIVAPRGNGEEQTPLAPRRHRGGPEQAHGLLAPIGVQHSPSCISYPASHQGYFSATLGKVTPQHKGSKPPG